MFFFSARAASGALPSALLAIVATLFSGPTTAAGTDLSSVLAGQVNMTIFSGLVKDYPDVFSKLSGVTIAAPNDNAFRKLGNWESMAANKPLIEARLKYHILAREVTMGSVIRGDSIFSPTLLNDPAFSNVTNGQQLILTKQPNGDVVFTSGFATRGTVLVEDLKFDGGLVQIIDSVMRVPEPLQSTARDAYTDLTAFLGALYATGLIDEFTDAANLTIFAPHNAAFQLLAGAFSDMGAEQIKRILSYHLVPGKVVHSWEMKVNDALDSSITDKKLHVQRNANSIFINSAQIIQADILLSNGVVQMIDNVLSPDSDNAKPNVTATAQNPVFTPKGATETGSAAPTPFITQLPCTVSCPVSQPTGGAGTGGGAAGEAGVRSTSSKGGVPAARCTGMAGAGLGFGLAVGALVVAL
ncbi:FAS1 domain-containing protein [Podospora didyma]|uniref:FAS1 domain-containing protein n=1 Tax=Podospora didyma TaxID=330526 RepID=A0AAE0NP73_9PEZI|nr:FAS1 domain-containing protein [Podospora didyma]